MDYDDRIQEATEALPTRREFFANLLGSSGDLSGGATSGRRDFISSIGKLLIAMVAFVFGSGLFGATPKADAQWEWYWWVDPWGRRYRRRRRRGRRRRRRRRRGRGGRGRRRRRR